VNLHLPHEFKIISDKVVQTLCEIQFDPSTKSRNSKENCEKQVEETLSKYMRLMYNVIFSPPERQQLLIKKNENLADTLVTNIADMDMVKLLLNLPLMKPSAMIHPPQGLHHENERALVVKNVDKFIESLCEISLGKTGVRKQVGSSFEGTRIGRPDEFDFLVSDLEIQGRILEAGSWVGDIAYCEFKVVSLPSVYKDAFVISNNTVKLSSVQYHRIIRDQFSQHLGEVRLESGLIKCKENVCDEFRRQAAASKCTLAWLGECYKGMNIDTDLVPTVIAEEWPEDAIKPEDLMPGLHYCEALFENRKPYVHLVCKPPHVDSELAKPLTKDQRDRLWRIDFAHVCSRIVASLPPQLKNVYIMAKALRGEMGRLLHPDTGQPILKPEAGDDGRQLEYEVSDLVTSFHLKMTFLHQVKKDFRHRKKAKLDDMVLHVYNRLVMYLLEGFLLEQIDFHLTFV
jgi:hypothetical protein